MERFRIKASRCKNFSTNKMQTWWNIEHFDKFESEWCIMYLRHRTSFSVKAEAIEWFRIYKAICKHAGVRIKLMNE